MYHEINYETHIKLLEHAKKYDYVSDKKAFLRSVSPYEQRLVLLTSKNPYEVLVYLDELDLKLTRQILNRLTYDEISNVLRLFSSEDKKSFYAHFSDLELVNKFIQQDQNAEKHIENLDFERKVELIDSSNINTVEATEIIYDSMNEKEQDNVSNYITDSDAVSALSKVEDNNENQVSNENNNKDVEVNKNTNENQPSKEQLQEQVEEPMQQKEEQPQEKQEKQDEEKNQDNQKEEIQKNEDNISKKEVLDIKDEEPNNKTELFHEEMQKCETETIKQIYNNMVNELNPNNLQEQLQEPSKTL